MPPNSITIRYVLNGGMQDWNYLHTNDFEITLELGCYKYPPHSQLDQYWQDNKEALLAFIERVHMGIKGFVLNAQDPSQKVANATIEVDEIGHSITATPQGEYYRLLEAGKTFTVSASAPGFERQVSKISVGAASSSKSAQVVNFLLKVDKSSEWSKLHDFDIKDNLATKYLGNDGMKSAMADLENAYPDLVQAEMNEAEWNRQVPALVMTRQDGKEEQKINIGIFGSVYGSQPLGRELVIRLARHLAQGFTHAQDEQIVSLLSNAKLFLFPLIDYEYFDISNEGDCSYDVDESMTREVGSKFRRRAVSRTRGVTDKVDALKFFFSTHHLNIGLSLEGEGDFIRLPYDNEAPETNPKRSKHESTQRNLMILAQAYQQAKINGQNNDTNNSQCHRKKNDEQIVQGSSLNGKYRGSFLDFAFEQGTDMISAHVTCCNFPHGRELPFLWQKNLPGLKAFLFAASQGVFGKISNLKGQELNSAQVKLDGANLEVTSDATFLALLTQTGGHRLSFSLSGYENKVMAINLNQGEMARENVVLDPIAKTQLKYHTEDQIGGLISTLPVSYPGKARVYPIGETNGKALLSVIELSDTLENSHLKPAIKVKNFVLHAQISQGFIALTLFCTPSPFATLGAISAFSVCTLLHRESSKAHSRKEPSSDFYV